LEFVLERKRNAFCLGTVPELRVVKLDMSHRSIILTDAPHTARETEPCEIFRSPDG
jgi:hypothetical protein